MSNWAYPFRKVLYCAGRELKPYLYALAAKPNATIRLDGNDTTGITGISYLFDS